VYDDSTPTSPTASPAAADTDDFLLDDIGNRTKCYLKSATATTYLHNAVNEYTKVDTTEYEYRCLCQLIFGVFCPFFRSFISFS